MYLLTNKNFSLMIQPFILDKAYLESPILAVFFK